ncbi:hypothetical protein V9K67_05400 [Paraflavisolibacter sp. H34]|uniref:hypothetical protein n=1 Tax=Huijunlia imazamoxiresistens TaxID=3127457 RepID=UPI00301779DF
MNQQISLQHKERFREIFLKLKIMSCSEYTFREIENLFYEALSITRNYGNDANENPYLAELKQMENKQYRLTQEKYRKSSQRERVIKQFRNSFREKLQGWI